MVVIGLGNPGDEYRCTRHNAGFMVVDALCRNLDVRLRRIWLRSYLMGSFGHGHVLVKPLTYMNRSGDIMPQLLRRTSSGPGDVLVIYDNVDLPTGVCRLKRRGSGGGGHHGIESIQRALGTGEFLRLSVGIGRPAGCGELAAYVLSAPELSEAEALRRGVERAAQAVLTLLAEGHEKVMNELNRRDGTASA